MCGVSQLEQLKYERNQRVTKWGEYKSVPLCLTIITKCKQMPRNLWRLATRISTRNKPNVSINKTPFLFAFVTTNCVCVGWTLRLFRDGNLEFHIHLK